MTDEHDSSIIEQQHLRWGNNDRVVIEDLLDQFGLSTDSHDTLMDLIYNEVLLREERGEEPEEAEYTLRFPDLADALKRQFQIHRAMKHRSLVGTSTSPRDGATVNLRTPTLDIPGFELQELVGRGGAGVVYRAYEKALRRDVAIKILQSGVDRDGVRHQQLVREAEAAASLRHKAIVPVHQIGEQAGTPYLVMEFMQGGSLAGKLAELPMSSKDSVACMTTVCEAIQAAHDAGIVHRDIKPGNILLDTEGRPHVSDFGLARRLDAETSLHATGDIVGTPAYMSPEQARGETATPLSDVYSLGAVLYHMLCGRPPFQAATPWEVIGQVLTHDVVPARQLNAAVPRDLETICDRCLEKDPNKRYASATEVAEELQRFATGKPINARPITRFQRLVKWCARNKTTAVLTAVSVAAVLTLGVGLAIAAVQMSHAEKQARKDRQVAVDSLANLVQSLYDDLTANAASIKTRTKVVDAAISGLGEITRLSADRQADESFVTAYHKIAHLQTLQGRLDDAKASYQSALDIAESLVKQSPDDRTARRLLGQSYGHLSTYHMSLNELGPAKQLIDKSEAIHEQLYSENSDDLATLQVLVAAQVQKLEWTRTSTVSAQKVVDAGGRAVELADRLVQLAPNEPDALSAAASVHFCMGRAHLEMNNPYPAQRHWKKSRTLRNRALKLAPATVENRSQSAALHRGLGMVAGLLGQREECERLFEIALQEFKALEQLDPDNLFQKQQVANTLSLSSAAYNARGKYTESVACLQQAIDKYTQLLDTSQGRSSIKLLIAEASLKQGAAFLYLRDWPAADRSFRFADQQVESSVVAEVPAAAMYQSASRSCIEATTLLLRTAVEQRTPTGEYLALCLAALTDADSSTSDQLSPTALQSIAYISPDLKATTFSQLFEYIGSIDNVHPFFATGTKSTHARCLGSIAENLSKSQDAADQQASHEKLTKCVELLKQFAAANPAAVGDGILAEAELEWVRSTDEFQAAGFAYPKPPTE